MHHASFSTTHGQVSVKASWVRHGRKGGKNRQSRSVPSEDSSEVAQPETRRPPATSNPTFLRNMSGKLVLITGVSGFIAGHVALAFLEAGYRVRGYVTARAEKLKKLNQVVSVPGLEFTQINDVATDDFTEALKDVDILVHVASPLSGKGSVDELLTSAINGTLNVLKQAVAAGVEKIVVTSSIAAAYTPGASAGAVISDSQWGQVTREEVPAHASDDFFVYSSSKILAERAVWKLAREHPNVDVATILPAFVFGPFPQHFPFPSSPSALGTNGAIYKLINGQVPPLLSPFVVDVRDVAKAHLLAVSVPRVPKGGDLDQKRFLVCSGVYTWKDVATDMRKSRPGLKTPSPENIPTMSGNLSTVDTTRAREVLGMKEWITPKKTVEDAVDSLVEAQKTWATL
ncbi:NAD(P)-binding protein [Pluteus cervinus]|uniref:NAD(P)-binding protein n=1 Tax=Pluteus cervinus TaxID=181527 RepID=A0ACD3A8F5_9AGAR|nr:NAD(P)-binding protein [Pluteus cervinus]